jgi:aminoglycoside 3-N-acetyltransferase
MLQKLDAFLKSNWPSFHGWLKGYVRIFKKKVNPQLSKTEFVKILTNDLGIENGDVVFVHSSMRNLYLDFDKSEILEILKEVVGSDGTLLFPCWQFNIRAEDYIKQNEIVFDINNTPSAMGKLSDVLRSDPSAFRSFHPTNSIVAIGKDAQELVLGHESDIYPCGQQSPWYKMMKYNAKIIGIGVTVDNLTFVHTVEDTMKGDFPIKTRMDQIMDCRCLDENGNTKIVKTLVASEAIGHRDVYGFFKKFISPEIYKFPQVKKMEYFSLKSVEAFKALQQLALNNKSIYNF